ncbi:hypothetical protein VIGAN_03099300 [Vigna angularis var. angularis]|uniref:Uncharacterized protein n=1 Tax=Vigna angularis var. angularis TaxID=157739 RepID=A0A0S3RL27_PHAAN|nr:hypothetical protein VIGAN_03099300 [Vigna angularis var. angularis]
MVYHRTLPRTTDTPHFDSLCSLVPNSVAIVANNILMHMDSSSNEEDDRHNLVDHNQRKPPSPSHPWLSSSTSKIALCVSILAKTPFGFDRNPRVTYKYDRMGEVQKQCASMLSASYELRYEYSVTGMKGGFSFVNGDWRQDGVVSNPKSSHNAPNSLCKSLDSGPDPSNTRYASPFAIRINLALISDQHQALSAQIRYANH